MEAIKKQANKLRKQVARQQESMLKQFSGRYDHDSAFADDKETECQQMLQMLYNSTRATKHFQREIVRCIEGFICISSKQREMVTKLATDCCKYGNEHESYGFTLASASLEFGSSHLLMQKESDDLLSVLANQVCTPLQAMITCAPLEDARHLTQRYDQIRRDVETQAADVYKRQLRSKEVGANVDDTVKLRNSETKLSKLKNILSSLGKEATAAMTSVEAQQQEVTFQSLHTMVDAERSYHQNAFEILDKLYAEIFLVWKQMEYLRRNSSLNGGNLQTATKDSESNNSGDLSVTSQNNSYFVAEVIIPFEAQADEELSLSVGDYVVVRQVEPHGWSEGECNGKAGWFPSAYVARKDKALAREPIQHNQGLM